MDKRTEQVLSDYEALHKEYGVGSVESLGWSTREVQEKRFGVMFEGIAGEVEGKGTMLDVGCGVGDIVNMVGFSNYVEEYVGIDMVKENVDRAEVRFDMGANISFVHGDFLEAGIWAGRVYDFVVASGTFAHYTPINIAKMMEKMWGLTRAVMVFNVLVPKTLNVYDLHLILDRVGVKRWVMRRDYWDGDVTVYGYKEG